MSDAQAISDVATDLRSRLEQRMQQFKGKDTKPEPYQEPDKPLSEWSLFDLEERMRHCDNPECMGGWLPSPDVPPHHPQFGKMQPCPDCKPFMQQMQRLRFVQKHERVAARFSSLEGDLLGMTFSDYRVNDDNRKAYRAVREWAGSLLPDVDIDAKEILYLYGGTGCGKTHLAAAAANGLIENNINTLFITVPDMKALISSRDFQEQGSVIEAIKGVSVLIVDDIGAENLTKWTQEWLYTIFNARYNTRTPTLYVSNLPPEGLDMPRVTSRILARRLSRVVFNKDEDRRLEGW